MLECWKIKKEPNDAEKRKGDMRMKGKWDII